MAFVLSQQDFPENLRHIAQSPQALYGEGDPNVLHKEMVAIVGARRCTPYGTKIAFELAKQLAEMGVVVISGLALGIDTSAHQGALAGGGDTVAVLGCGLKHNYLAKNRSLREEITKRGAVITEYEDHVEASTWSFPRRNRIISGLSRGVLVIEAGLKSGSLITAKWALEQGREVFAVPGPMQSPMSQGTHQLIQQGAKLVTSVDDILEEIPQLRGKVAECKKMKYNPGSGSDQEKILYFLANSVSPVSIDRLVEASELPTDRINGLLVELELDGKVKGLPGGLFMRG